ncbi:Ankyrin repeatcontaining protein [Acanthamoeba castellanii str. Neff]|uniref:Ankyrin repeatcontaining protein n=1 Tax=Acanthamoeba castellanii (strain ATCC 30010 / Neff) TaxID=1257118 RepID=L8GP86_ACACF|nr:Ankyrin repeatcontaining protein [Acanthamoeba castellanii str. Neff]ELR14795.1 Ankyrin repeatcontaining protein [Acanthamoeba castellanii str. Neff]
MSEKSGFIWAVRTGDVKGVQDGLSKGENVNQVDETVNRRTPLHHAADFGHAEVLQMLIAKGADVNAQDAFGITPLLAAVYEGHTEAVQVLVKAKADVNAKGPDGMSALEAAEKDEVKAILKSAGAK